MTLLCVVLAAHGILYAQTPLSATKEKQPKPYLFSSLPDSFEVSSAELTRLFSPEINSNVSVQLSAQFKIEGIVVDKNQHTPGSVSINIRIRNYDNALFNATLRLQADNSTSIQGRILHPRYGDVLELYKQNNKYFIRKISQRLYMPE
jgi:hypothetical protein